MASVANASSTPASRHRSGTTQRRSKMCTTFRCAIAPPLCFSARRPAEPSLRVPAGGKARSMRALTWHGRRDVRVDTVPDPDIEEPTDAIIRVTTTAICGSDLHLYEVLGPFLDQGDILGHEPM